MIHLSITKLKMLAVGVGLVLVIAVAFAFQRQQRRNLGRLVVLKQAIVGSNFTVRLRWERPDKHLGIVTNPLFGKDETGKLWKVPADWDESKQELTLIAPSNRPSRWFVETEVVEPIDGISKFFLRARKSLESKSLSPLRGDIGPFYRPLGTVKSDYITNVAPSPDASSKSWLNSNTLASPK